ncbi:hypothetical protein AWB69_03208 [Caballeronia udeis]|uniref:Uncharacterized protein n=2 Tax=Caballeronia udeis TaxID=1232866 RepID=A0A158GSS7_9BURK|nr:hypothetical protein AWB69_03208 [Caballeronia udeis]
MFLAREWVGLLRSNKKKAPRERLKVNPFIVFGFSLLTSNADGASTNELKPLPW